MLIDKIYILYYLYTNKNYMGHARETVSYGQYLIPINYYINQKKYDCTPLIKRLPK